MDSKNTIYDNIHGDIHIDPIAQSIIDTPEFQRLRYIHQTGVLYLVFPTAVHSRFEHSLGVYHLGTMMIKKLKEKHPEINISNEIILLVSIAGLCHDLGHLLFSHLFDDYFLEKLPNYNELKNITKNVVHENRSIFLLNHIVEKYNINLNKDQLKVIADLINPKDAKYTKWKSKYQIGEWIMQIISNPINSIDVDKFDYLTRDTKAVGLKYNFNYKRIINDVKIINDKLCYSSQCSEDIYQMFFIRYRLHRQIYNHKTVKAIEILIINLLFEIEKEHQISNYILDADNMIKLVDHFIWNYNNDIISKIYFRKIPKLVYQNVSLVPIIFDENKIKEKFCDDNYCIIRYKAGYVGGKSTNPLNKIIFYNIEDNKIISDNKVKSFSLLINQKFQEYFLNIYCTNLDLVNNMNEYFNNDLLNDNKTEIIQTKSDNEI